MNTSRRPKSPLRLSDNKKRHQTMKDVAPISLILICLVFLADAQAVNPPPDGGYAGFTTAEGTNALTNLTTGIGNTATGWYSLFASSTASFNTAVGAGALLVNTV